VVVAGAAGFLGRAIVGALGRRDHEVVELTRAEADIADPAALARLDARGDVLVNAAARTPAPGNDDLRAYLAANTVGAAELIAWALGAGIRRIVHCSTLAVVARPWPVPLDEAAPTYPIGAAARYAVSKLAGEVLVATQCRAAGVPYVILRESALYGPGMAWHGLVPRFVDLALGLAPDLGSGLARAPVDGRPRVDAGGQTTVDLLHVDDAAAAVAAAVEADVTGVLHVAAGDEVSIARVAELVLAAAGRATDEYDVVADGVAARAVVSIERIRRELGWAPAVPLADGLRAVVAARRAAVRT
jgi:nucleoside-diphosphate-sugar epimerase